MIDVGLVDPSPANVDDLTVYVTTAENATVLDTYQRMKSDGDRGTVFVLANRVDSEAAGWEVLERFCSASGKHLARKLSF